MCPGSANTVHCATGPREPPVDLGEAPNSLCTEAECSKSGREHVLEDCSDYIILHLLVISFHAKQRNAFNLCVFANPQYRGKHTKNANLFVVARKVIVVHIFD